MIEPRSGLESCHAQMAARPPLRLSARLGRDTPFTVIRSPHGFGKSALAAEWVRSAGAAGYAGVLVPPPPAGIGSERFWRLAAERLTAAGVLANTPPDDTATYPAIRDDLARTGSPVRLALERIDHVTDPQLEEQILDLVDHCDGVHVAVTVVGRTLFGNPLALDPTHDLLGGDDLLLRRTELRDLFAADGITVDADELDLIHRLTGGMWSLVEIARTVTGGLPSRADRLPLLGDRLAVSISDHVRTTILAAPDVVAHRDFLVNTATAHTITVETAQFLGSGTGAAQHLAAIEAAGLADCHESTSGPQWQIPVAVRRELRAIQHEGRMDPAARSTRLALFHRDRREYAAAIRCALEAENWPLTVELVEKHWIGLVGAHLDLLRDVLRALPEHFFDTNPGFREAQELVASLDGDVRSSTQLHDPEELRHLTSADDVGKTVGIVSHQTLMLRLAGRYDAAAELTQQIRRVVSEVLEARPDDLSDLLPFLRMQWGLTFQLAGDFSESTEVLRLAYLLGNARRLAYIARNAAGNSALNWALAGEPERVREWLDLELAHPPADDAVEPLIRIGGLTARALTALDRLDFTAAEVALGQLDQLPVVAELWPFVVYARCRHAVATGRPDRALATLADVADKRQRAEGGFVRSLLTAAEIEALLAAGHGSRACLLAARTPSDTPWSVVAVARTHLITGNHHSTITTCRRYDWLGTPFTRSHLEALLIETAAQHALGRVDRAAQLWRRACELADRTGIRAAFAGLPRDLVIALEKSAAVPSQTAADYLASEVADQYPSALHRPELTEREKAVLDGLADGLSAPAIAQELFVSLSTVKTQRTSLYRKLGAHSRREALAVAREFGLLPIRDDADWGRREQESGW
ncbi:LuxR family maltose regulon positive regulatory protein [Rhodococcus sp. LBL1]|nr:LuxR family maltose regulon positive regulatory protein [Rhodococcus sp. LBL1]MDH6684541.1 LuxR family maltose regulon positive regulatory protein [Rhodococcus sp. LBL2]